MNQRFVTKWVIVALAFIAVGSGTESFGAELLEHGSLKICYDPSFRLARYVEYELSAERLKKRFIARDSDPFAVDPLLENSPSALVKAKEYSGSHFDKGHLGPAEDFSWDEDNFISSFYMSNMAPQVGYMNQQTWKRLEMKVRRWACGEKRVTIFTGPVLKSGLKKMDSGLAIPELFYKVVVDESAPRKSAGFLYRNDKSAQLPDTQLVPVATISRLTKIDFSSKLESGGDPGFSKTAKLKDWAEGDCDGVEAQVSASEVLKRHKAKAPARTLASVKVCD